VDKVVPIEEWKKLVSSAQEVLNNGTKLMMEIKTI
jgi:hypothetical protein